MRAFKWVLLIGAFAYLPLVHAAFTPIGNWKTIDDKTGKARALVHISEKDGVLSAKIDKVFAQPGDTGICSKCPGQFKNKPITGLQFLWGLKERHTGTWDDGQILDPKTGKVYRAKITLKGDKLFVRGYVGLSLLGRTQIWLRQP